MSDTENLNEAADSGLIQPRIVRRGCWEPSGSLGNTSMEYIRRSYGVPAKRGMRICYSAEGPGEPNGTITGARDARLLIRLDGWPKRRRPLALHPTWNIHYHPKNDQGHPVQTGGATPPAK